MTIEAEVTRVIELFQLPFMQRALLGGVLTGLMGGLLGSFTILRQLSFFSEALGESALLGIGIGLLLNLNPSWVLLPFAVLFALGIAYFLEHTHLWNDTLLSIVCSSSLALGIIVLSFRDEYQGGINNLLFGDILAVRTPDLIFSAVLLCACAGFIGLTLRSQILMTLHEPMAIARGVNVSAQRTAFIVLLSLVVGISIKAIGVLLISDFIVIPASAARMLSRKFTHYILISAGLGAVSAVAGMLLSALFDLPSGPSIVAAQMGAFLLATLIPTARALAS
ncbi:MAG: metal ABC transporter permease [Elainellaceae cyanobacterium]